MLEHAARQPTPAEGHCVPGPKYTGVYVDVAPLIKDYCRMTLIETDSRVVQSALELTM